MRIVKPLHLVPQRVHLRGAIFLDLRERRHVVDQLAVLEDRHEQLLRREVVDVLPLPRGLRIKNFKIPAVVHDLIVQADIVRDGLSGVVAVEAVDLLKVRVRDLADVLADLDLRDDVARLVLDGGQLVHAAEHRLAARGDEPLAHAEQVDLRTLIQQILNEILIQRVRAADLAALPARLVEHFARLLRQIGHVAGVEPDAALRQPSRFQHLVEHTDRVRHARLQYIIGVHQQRGVVRVNFAVRLERLVFAVEHLHPRMGHRAACRHAVQLVRQRAGRALAAADVRRARTEHGRIAALRPSRT